METCRDGVVECVEWGRRDDRLSARLVRKHTLHGVRRMMLPIVGMGICVP